MNMIILKGRQLRIFHQKKRQKQQNYSTSNASTEATRSPKNMVDTALDLPGCPFSNLSTLRRL